MCKSAKYLAIILLLTPVLVWSQLNDAGLITGISASKSLGRSFSLKAEQEFRLNNRIAAFDRSLTGISVDYRIIKSYLKVGVDYNLIYQKNTTYYTFRHRSSAWVTGSYQFRRFEFDVRSRVQSTWRDNARGEYKINPKLVWRNKLEIAYDIFGSPVKPYVSGEIILPINDRNPLYLNAYRLVAGAKYRYSQHETVEVFARFDQDVQQSDAQNIFYLGAGWNYRF